MAIFREIPPTAGFALRAKDLLSVFSAARDDGALERDFTQYLRAGYARITCSGTAAFYLILEALKERSEKRTVVIPSFVCPLIPLAVKRAGMKARVCDITGRDFNYSHDELEAVCAKDKDIVALLAVHLGGVPVDFDRIAAACKRHGIFTIEDCAQSLGAEYKGRKTGTLGDAAFFSLSRGKGITTYEGGAIVTDKKELWPAIDRAMARLVTYDKAGEAWLLALLFGYWLFYRPLLFWPVFRLPQRFWNWKGDRVKAAAEDFSMDFPVRRMSGARQAVGHSQFHRLDGEIKKQREKAASLIQGLKKIKGVSVIEEEKGSMASYPYLTITFEDTKRRARALAALEGSGMGGSFVYAMAIADYGYLSGIVADENCRNGRSIAESSITLSTSAFLGAGDIETVLDIIERS